VESDSAIDDKDTGPARTGPPTVANNHTAIAAT
jgi:hypothetical protein